MKEITIPPLVTELSSGVFALTKIENIVIPSTVKIIREQAVTDCDNLKTVVIEEGVDVIEDKAFSSCDILESISFPASAVELGTSIFYGSRRDDEKLLVYVPQGSIAETVFTEEYSGFEYYDIISQ